MFCIDHPEKRRVIGVMTGSSVDGFDACLVEISGQSWELKPTYIKQVSQGMTSQLREAILKVSRGEETCAEEVAQIKRDYSEAIVCLIQELYCEYDYCVVHGQTLYHKPPLSWQMVDASYIAQKTQKPVGYDLRSADLTWEGQGAPITPLSDLFMYGDNETEVVIVNLGGFINITQLPRLRAPLQELTSEIQGLDLFACNQWLDQLYQKAGEGAFDESGRKAALGVVNKELKKEWVKILQTESRKGRSLGDGDRLVLGLESSLKHEDLLRTACAAIAEVLGDHCGVNQKMVLAGGGALNKTLVSEIDRCFQGEVVLSDELGWPIQARESAAMAVLGSLSLDGVPITLAQVTNCSKPSVAGAWAIPLWNNVG